MNEDEFTKLLDALEAASKNGYERLNETVYTFGYFLEKVFFVFQQQQAEITRLKDALQKVVNEFDPWDPSTTMTYMSENMAEIAKEALEKK